MKELDFPKNFTQWIMTCVTIVNYSISVNGNPSQTFEAANGPRQGDVISRFLFVIAMEYLSMSLSRLKDDKSYKFHPKWSKLGITGAKLFHDQWCFAAPKAVQGSLFLQLQSSIV